MSTNEKRPVTIDDDRISLLRRETTTYHYPLPVSEKTKL